MADDIQATSSINVELVIISREELNSVNALAMDNGVENIHNAIVMPIQVNLYRF